MLTTDVQAEVGLFLSRLSCGSSPVYVRSLDAPMTETKKKQATLDRMYTGAKKDKNGLKITKDADIGKFFPVPVRVKAEQEGPLQGHETPDARQIKAFWVSNRLLLSYRQGKESDESD